MPRAPEITLDPLSQDAELRHNKEGAYKSYEQPFGILSEYRPQSMTSYVCAYLCCKDGIKG